VLHVSPFPGGRRYKTGSAPAGETTVRKSKGTSSCIEIRYLCVAIFSGTWITHGGRSIVYGNDIEMSAQGIKCPIGANLMFNLRVKHLTQNSYNSK
jgi:hypothetical protein